MFIFENQGTEAERPQARGQLELHNKDLVSETGQREGLAVKSTCDLLKDQNLFPTPTWCGFQ